MAAKFFLQRGILNSKFFLWVLKQIPRNFRYKKNFSLIYTKKIKISHCKTTRFLVPLPVSAWQKLSLQFDFKNDEMCGQVSKKHSRNFSRNNSKWTIDNPQWHNEPPIKINRSTMVDWGSIVRRLDWGDLPIKNCLHAMKWNWLLKAFLDNRIHRD